MLLNEEGKHLVGGTEGALLLEKLSLLLGDLLVDLGALAGLVAVGSGLYDVLACCCCIRGIALNVREEWRPSRSAGPGGTSPRPRSRASPHARACWQWCARPLVGY